MRQRRSKAAGSILAVVFYHEQGRTALPEPSSKVPPTPFVEHTTASHWLAPCIFKNKSKKALSFQLFNISASRLQQTRGLQTDIED